MTPETHNNINAHCCRLQSEIVRYKKNFHKFADSRPVGGNWKKDNRHFDEGNKKDAFPDIERSGNPIQNNDVIKNNEAHEQQGRDERDGDTLSFMAVHIDGLTDFLKEM